VDLALGKGVGPAAEQVAVGPACQRFAESCVNGSRHRNGSHHQPGPPTDTALPRATGWLSADRPSVLRVRLGALGKDVGLQLTPSHVTRYVTRVKWGSRHICVECFFMAHGRGPFAGPAVPSGLCREFPLGRGCAESIRACAERSSLSAKPRIPVVSAWMVQMQCKWCFQ
jgi:hypothetical protein